MTSQQQVCVQVFQRVYMCYIDFFFVITCYATKNVLHNMLYSICYKGIFFPI